MDIFQALFLGIIQGLTEWLPVSSSGHLVIFQNLFGISPPIFFDLLLHIGTVLAVTVYFWKDIISLNRKTIIYIIIGTIITGLVGFGIKDQIEMFFTNTTIIGSAFLLTGFLLLSTKFFNGQDNIRLKHPILLGLVQGLAIIPGLSRSGVTISAGIISGAKREKIAKFSFLMSIPAIIAATAYKFQWGVVDPINATIGIIAAFIVGYFSIGILMNLIKKQEFWVFSIYCFTVGIFVILIL
jgi:undecaprenyl-diphosphatase